jgi:Zn-dependent protease/predicted transcriptional regulator
LHFTLIIVFFLIAWTLAASLMPETHPGLTRIAYWVMGILGAVILFVSVLLHELAHSIMSLRYGLKVRQIMLFIFGGVSDIEEDEEISKNFHKEFKTAVVGPIASFVIAGIFGISWLVLSNIHTSTPSATTVVVVISTNEIKSIAEGVLRYAAFVNVLLGGFNLIPAFPLDGGRILRSALLRWRRDYDQSTKTAVRIGIAISYGFMAFGFIIMLSGSFIGGIWILLIGWFLNSGAQSYLQRYELSSILSKILLEDIMNTNIISVKENKEKEEEVMTINRLVTDYFNIYSKDSFPIINNQNYLIGMVTFKDAWNIPEHERDITTIRNIMIPLQNLIVMQPNRTANEALMQMTRKQMGKVFVCNEQGKLIGLVSKTDLLNAASERKQYREAVKKGYV